MKTMMVVAMVCSLVIIGGTAFGASGKTAPPAWREGGAGELLASPGQPNPTGETCFIPVQPKGLNTFEASWLISQTVRSPNGDSLGQISKLVIDQANERIALVILSDVPNLGAERLAIPYSSLVRTGENTFVLSFGDRTPYMGMGSGFEGIYLHKLTTPPAISDLYGIPSVMDANWVSEIYRHHGQVRYWKERGEKLWCQWNFIRAPN